jgi:hypothetical protein
MGYFFGYYRAGSTTRTGGEPVRSLTRGKGQKPREQLLLLDAARRVGRGFGGSDRLGIGAVVLGEGGLDFAPGGFL